MKNRFFNIKLTLKSLKYFRLNSLFYRMLLTSLIVVSIMFIINYCCTAYIKKQITDKEIKSQQSYLNYNASYIDNVLKKIKDAMYIMENDNNVKLLSLMNQNNYTEHYRECSNITEKLISYKSIIQEINNFYIYYPRMNRVLCTDGMNVLDSYLLRTYNNVEASKKMLNKKYFYSIEITDKSISKNLTVPSRICILKSLQGNMGLDGTIVVNLDEMFIKKIFINQEFAKDRKIFIINEDSQIICSNTDDEIGKKINVGANQFNKDVNGKCFIKDGYLVSYNKSSLSSLSYIIYMPLESIYKDMDGISHAINMFLFIFLIIGILFSLYISQSFYFPISKMVEILSTYSIINDNKANRQNEMDVIKDNYMRILTSNNKLKDSVVGSIPLIMEVLMHKIITCQDINDTLAILNEYNIEFKDGYYCTSTILMSDYGSDEVQDIIRQHLSDYLLSVFKIRENEYTVVMYYNDIKVREQIYTELHSICNKLFEITGNTGTYIGIGEAFNDIFKINISYKQALKAIDARSIQEKDRVLDYMQKKDSTAESVIIPVDMEQRLINMITAGNMETALKFTSEILNSNYNRNIPFNSYLTLCISIQRVINNIMNDWSFNKDSFTRKGMQLIENIENDYSVITDNLLKNVRTICMYFVDTGKMYTFMDKVISYIDDNFTKDIYLELVANEFKYNVSYLSKCFKQYKGISFSDYLAAKRINFAKELLINTNKTVKDIAAETGYSSPNILIRAFEKHEGISPSRFRRK